jgi:hypothetical protein
VSVGVRVCVREREGRRGEDPKGREYGIDRLSRK